MPEVTRQLRVTFSRDEIKEILSEQAKTLLLTRKEITCVTYNQVEDLQSDATVVLYVGNKPIEVPLRDKLLFARRDLVNHLVGNQWPRAHGKTPTKVKLTDAEILEGIREINDYLDGRQPYERDTKVLLLTGKRRALGGDKRVR